MEISLTRYERETVVIFNEAEPGAACASMTGCLTST